MARAGLKVAISHTLVVPEQRLHYILRLPFGEEDVPLVRYDEALRLDACACTVQPAVALAGVEKIHGTRDVQIAVRVETLEELLAVVREIALDLEIRLELRVSPVAFFFGGIHETLLQLAVELILEEFARKVCYVGQLAGGGEPLLGSEPVAYAIVVAIVPVRVFRDAFAPHDIERKRLGVETRACSDQSRTLHLVWMAGNPIHHLYAAVAAADKRGEFLHPELPEQHAIDVYRIAHRILRE